MPVRIDYACPLRWEDLVPGADPTRRGCEACGRVVTDLSLLTRAQALALYAVGEQPCVRVRVDTGGEPVFRDTGRRMIRVVAPIALLAGCVHPVPPRLGLAAPLEAAENAAETGDAEAGDAEDAPTPAPRPREVRYAEVEIDWEGLEVEGTVLDRWLVGVIVPEGGEGHYLPAFVRRWEPSTDVELP
ncbi:MAG: hypothetical protein Q8P41_19085 [Pseudomonadota bacterium]|nr:hypothetical protein [Pseudomonadota bacterium]